MTIDVEHIKARSERIQKHFGLILDDEEKIKFYCMGLFGEIGEVANLVKKRWRSVSSTSYDDINEELMDVFIYLILLMDSTGFDLEKEYQKNINKLNARWGLGDSA